jgi:hypothetical protein
MTRSRQYRTREEQLAAPKVGEEPPPEALLHIAKSLESQHYGHYVMINSASRDYVVAPTISAVHSQFIDAFGWEATGFCLRIGASPFATA